MPGDPSFELSFSEEPLTKYPRLSGDWEDNFILHHADKTDVMDTESIDQEVLPIDEHTEEYLNATMQDTCELPEDTNTNDKGVMVGVTGIADLKAECGGNIGRFEIIQDVGYSSESSTHLSNDERQEFIRVYSYSPVCSGPSLISEYAVPNQPKETNEQNEPKKSAPGFPYLPPDKYPSVSFKAWQFGKGEEPFHIFKQKTSSLIAPTSTFYKMTTIDPDAVEDGIEDQLCAKQMLDNDSTNPDETIHELTNQNNSNPAIKTSQNNVELSVGELSTSVAQVQLPPEDVRLQLRAWAENPDKDAFQKLQKKPAKNAQVREWLHKNLVNKLSDKAKMEIDIKSRTLPNSLLVDSSCDASGEYTTNESESEQSSSSADNNGSLVMSRSYTGSVETVIPITEESKNQQEEGSGSADSTSCVTMRNKRKSMKDRPWSVIELNRISNGLRVSPLSTSEGALDALCITSPQNKNADFRHCSSKWLKGMNRDPASPAEEIFNSNTTGNKPRRNRSRGSLNSASYHSDSGSDDRSPNNSLCRSTYSDQPHFSTPTRRRKSSNLALDKSTIHLSPVHQNQLLNSHLSVSNNASNKKRNSHLLSNAQQKPAQLSSVPDSDQALTQTEDQSSVSDQVWDGYQDPPYFSEPYSEQALNEEEVRKLIEFGDDYGAYLGCHSDASSMSDGHHLFNKIPHSRPQSFVSTAATEVHIDSDSDMEDLQHIFTESTRHLQKAKSTFKRNMSQNDASNSDYAELIATCQTHLNCLEVIADHLSKGDKTIGSEDFSQITSLIEEWQFLKKSILSKQKTNTDRQNSEEYLAIQNSLTDLSNKITELTTPPLQCNTTLDLLKQRIATLQTSRLTLQQTKDSLLEISKRIVRLMADADLLTCPLKDRFNHLYQKWEDIYEENGTHLTDLQHMYQKWNNCDVLCQQLQESLEKKRTSEVNGEMIASAEKQLSKLRAMLSEVKELLGMGEPWQELSERVAHLQTKMCSKDVSCTPMQTEQRRRGVLFWRTVRFAIPIQLALVLLYCLACLLEPRCCDLVNNLNFSLLPQLRYIRGPPPV